MNEQKQVQEGGHATFSVKVTKEVYDLVNILCEGLQHGTNGNDLVKMFIHSFIESAKHDGPISPEIRMFLNMLTLDPGWNKAFNFADVTAQTEVAQVILILQEKDRHGFGVKMITKPFCGESTETACVDDIVERILTIAMPGLAKKIREVCDRFGCRTIRETLLLFCEYMIDALNREEEQSELPGYDNRHDWGRAIEYGQRTKNTKRRTIDGEANRQQCIHFDESDVPDLPELREKKDNENFTPDFRPFDVEW